MKNKITHLSLLLLFTISISAQSIWDSAHLETVKQSLSQPVYAIAYRQLLEDAKEELTKAPLSVMMKEKTPASGNKHDYMSQARYYWADPGKPDGLPYISRDGESNPELEKLDRIRLGNMANGVITLSLAWYFSGDEKYAQKATELIRIWFLNKDTRMNPNLNYSQMIPGHNEGKGRCYGVIDAYSFVEMLDAVQVLEKSKAFTTKDSKQLKEWFGKLTEWILTSDIGQEEARQANNHAVAHDAQVIAFAIYSGNKAIAERVLNEFPAKRIFTQIEPDGSQPQELRRTLAFGYSEYNIQHMIDIFQMGQKIGISIDNATSPDGRNFYKAVDFLASYFGKEKSLWPYQQISEWDYKQSEFGKDLYRTYLLNPSRTDYLQSYRSNQQKNDKDRFNLTFFKADITDHAFTFASNQLQYAMLCAEETKKENQGKRLVSPRTIEKDGSLRLVAPRNWCSGFFPGSLWFTYNYNRTGYWRQQAVSYTWPVEEMKWYKGTHDLGFIINNSFGQAYRLTGERSYKDVVIQASRSLVSRYNDKVKAIRSWDHNKDKWQYPVIIDNMMNLEMLFWTAEETGDSTFRKIAVNHANTTLKNHFRDDNSSYHVIDYNPETGVAQAKHTHQGIHHESVWSRGQAWGLYGFTMCYRFTKDPAYLKQAEKIADYFFGLSNMPEDLVPYWDMKDPAIPQAPRDASAAAIIASGLYELATYTAPEKKVKYMKIADTITENLFSHYQAEPEKSKGFLLLHSTGNYPSNDEIDKPISYADYYYLEALLRRVGITNY
ncbi:MAG: alginate lyase family protein [Tannerella sp.]|jgi:hypothetical protein|nr:alginate lyase family protein [Tannerella sp.]